MVERMREPQARGNDDEISLSDIFACLKRRVLLIGIVTGVVVFSALLYVILAKPLYTASTAVMPATSSGGTLGNLSGGLAGAAALAGIDLSAGDTDKQEYIAVLKSRDLARKFIKSYGLLPELFPERWDEEKGAWRPVGSGGFRLWLSRMLASISEDEGWRVRDDPVPSEAEAFKAFDDIRNIEEDTTTGLLTVSFEFRDPGMSAEWANEYIAMANDTIRRRTIEESSRALDYLNEQVQKTTIAGLRDTLYSLVEKQLENITLANARRDYAFRVIDPAVMPEQRSSPKRALIVAVSIILGGALGIFIALIVSGIKGDLIQAAHRTDR